MCFISNFFRILMNGVHYRFLCQTISSLNVIYIVICLSINLNNVIYLAISQAVVYYGAYANYLFTWLSEQPHVKKGARIRTLLHKC